MANSATFVDSVTARCGSLSPVYEYEIAIDTVDTLLDVRTPATGKRLFVVGVWLAESIALNLTFLSGVAGGGSDSKSQTFELAANQGLSGYVSDSWMFATKPSEALKIRSSAAIGSTVGKNLIIRVVEGDYFRSQKG